MNRAWHDALEALERRYDWKGTTALGNYESRVLAAMAAAHLGLGDRGKLWRSRRNRSPSAGAAAPDSGSSRLCSLGSALSARSSGVQATSEIEATLAEADAWLEMSGAKSHEPFLHVERAELARLSGDEATRQRELREAHRLFLEIGAPIRAAQVAKELAG